jgi:XTP/dITP diphosphohydrolase
MTPDRLVLATGNAGKVGELTALVREWGPVTVLSLADFPDVVPPEEGETSYVDNAVAKACAAAAATGLPALGDDAGLEVDALGGAPGVLSARYAASADARIARLLAALAGTVGAARTARFRCALAVALPDGRVVTAEGTCEGRIADAPSGAGGFGYDPVFVSDDLGETFGTASAAAKARVSHRARAMRAMGERLASIARPGGPC